jgi:hypothetical protein
MRSITILSFIFALTLNTSWVKRTVAADTQPQEASANLVAALKASPAPINLAAEPRHPPTRLSSVAPMEAPKDVAARFLALLEEYNAAVGRSEINGNGSSEQFWIKRNVVSKDLLEAFKNEALGRAADPFLNAQDIRQGFFLQKMAFQEEVAKLTIGFKGEGDVFPIVYILVKEGNEWKLDDIEFRYPDGSMGLLTEQY